MVGVIGCLVTMCVLSLGLIATVHSGPEYQAPKRTQGVYNGIIVVNVVLLVFQALILMQLGQIR